ncbi:MAG: hypothetical protein V3T92_00695 [Anaerolineae bacterium]
MIRSKRAQKEERALITRHRETMGYTPENTIGTNYPDLLRSVS